MKVGAGVTMGRVSDRGTLVPCLADQANDNRPQPALLPAAGPVLQQPEPQTGRHAEEIHSPALLHMPKAAQEARVKESLQDKMMHRLFERERVMWAIAAILMSMTLLAMAVRHLLD